MTTLTEFLLARIAEDEERLVHEFDCDRFNVYDYGVRQGDCDCDATPRLLAECEAKRRIVEALGDYDGGFIWASTESYRAETALGALALPYADHPDYDPEWRPS